MLHDGLYEQMNLANQIISTIMTETKETDFDALSVAERAEQLLALFYRQNSIWAIDEKAKVVRPETSIAQSSLFTGAVHEPQMYTELKKEIVSRLWMKMTKNILWCANCEEQHGLLVPFEKLFDSFPEGICFGQTMFGGICLKTLKILVGESHAYFICFGIIHLGSSCAFSSWHLAPRFRSMVPL